jgi:CheY-like chemotaxis protein
MTCRILERAGYCVLRAGNAPEALRISRGRAGRIDLLLSDIEMPGMSGIELARHLRVERPGIAVLLISGNSSNAQATEFRFLDKPFVPNVLLGCVSNELQSSSATVTSLSPQPVDPPIIEPLLDAAFAGERTAPVKATWNRMPRLWRPLPAMQLRVAAAIVLSLVSLNLLQRVTQNPEPVNLRAVRGVPGNAAEAGKPLVLNLDLSALPKRDSYRIELVGMDGNIVWREVVSAPSSDTLSARCPALLSGIYFVRVYSPPEALLREYELRIEEHK